MFPVPLDPDALDAECVKDAHPFLSIGVAEAERLIEAADLTDKQREVCLLRFIGLGQGEIADMLGISQSAVAQRLDKAERRLRKQWGHP